MRLSKTIGDGYKWIGRYFLRSQPVAGLEVRGWHPDNLFEGGGKGGRAVITNEDADLENRLVCFQQLPGVLDPDAGQVVMRRFAIGGLE